MPHNILYLQSTSEIGGSDISLIRLVEALDSTRWRAHVVLPAEGPLVGSLARHGCQVFILSEMVKLTTRQGLRYVWRYVWNYPRAVWRIARLIRQARIDLVHTNSLHNLYGFAAAALTRCPHLWHVREIVWQSKIVRALEVFLARHFADRIVVTSDAVGQMFNRRNGRYPAHLRKIANGIDLQRYHPGCDGRRVFDDLHISQDSPLVGLVCRLDAWKGVETFLRAAAACRQPCPTARFLVVGGAIEGQEAYAAKLKALAEGLDLGEVVYFTGWRYRPEDMPSVHAALTVAVLASTQPEPFGLVVLEAMASGKPVVATNHGGPREICVDGETALLVPPGNAEKMAEAIIGLLQDPAKARAMGAAGRRRVEERFDQTRCVHALEDVYGELVRVGAGL